jgi:urease beta subunit
MDTPQPPGAIKFPDDELRELNTDREQTDLRVRNEGDHLVQIGSHYHFFEANPALGFDRVAAFGKRLNLPPGDRVCFPPGETMTVTLVPFGGERRVRSFYGVVEGSIDECDPHEALVRFRLRAHESIASPPEGDDDG